MNAGDVCILELHSKKKMTCTYTLILKPRRVEKSMCTKAHLEKINITQWPKKTVLFKSCASNVFMVSPLSRRKWFGMLISQSVQFFHSFTITQGVRLSDSQSHFYHTWKLIHNKLFNYGVLSMALDNIIQVKIANNSVGFGIQKPSSRALAKHTQTHN